MPRWKMGCFPGRRAPRKSQAISQADWILPTQSCLCLVELAFLPDPALVADDRLPSCPWGPIRDSQPTSMRHPLSFVLLALAWLVAPATAQNRAQATLYTRVDGSDLRVAVEFKVDKGWKLYHTDLGDPDAIAIPLGYEFQGVEGPWSELRVLDPDIDFIDDLTLGSYSVQFHKGTAYGYARGTLAPGASAEALALDLAGQTCDPSACVPYSETIRSKGAGPDAIWAKFPADLVAQEVVSAGSGVGALPVVAALPGGGAAEAESGTATTSDWEPSFAAGKHVDARLEILTDGNQVRAVVKVAVRDTWHLYNGPTSKDIGPNEPAAVPTVLDFSDAGPVVWQDPVYPESHGYPGFDKDLNDIEVQVLEGHFEFTIEGELEAGADPQDLLDVAITIEGQTCDEGSCVPFQLELEHEGDAITVLDAMPAQAAQPITKGHSQGGDDGLLAFLLQAVFWGFITLLMPCTYPMIPITISFFTKQADQREGNVLPLSLAYGAGIVGMFVVIGVVVGPPIQVLANHPVFNLFIAGMFVFFACVLFGWVNLQPPAFLNNAAGKASSTGGLLGVFLMGLTLVITSFTCTAPFVGTLLASAGDQGLLRTAIGMGVFGLTLATPFVLLSLFPGRMKKMPTAGAWMNTLKVFLGFVELAASLKFLSTADLGWDWGFLSKEVFLLGWGSIFLVASAFLFGWINLKGEEDGVISPGRMVGATATFVYAAYTLFLIGGFKMDPLMVAFAPPYSTAPERAAGHTGPKEHAIVTDDYEGAVSEAKAKKKALLVNFTGYN